MVIKMEFPDKDARKNFDETWIHILGKDGKRIRYEDLDISIQYSNSKNGTTGTVNKIDTSGTSELENDLFRSPSSSPSPEEPLEIISSNNEKSPPPNIKKAVKSEDK